MFCQVAFGVPATRAKGQRFQLAGFHRSLARFVRVGINREGFLDFYEVEIYGTDVAEAARFGQERGD